MRNLSFGALIVLVGFVAALPFRKVPPHGSADADASLATGPSTGLVVTGENVSLDPLAPMSPTISADTVATPWSHVASPMLMTPERPVSRSRSTDSVHPQMAARIPSDAQSSPRRDLRLPLTYDDLAVPLVTPGYVDERYSAIAKPATGSPAVDASPTKFEPLAMTNAAVSEATDAPFQQFDSQPPSVLASRETPTGKPSTVPFVSAKPSIEGRLASDTRPASQETDRDDRPRHWIRQPSE
ncbi:hypothetical protein [Neorhodopirellula pilleata]|uniref:Uncharacterized protein n=1 Tax=Neorhodopirellula pilleata TaxID=2714738 RepID=A0A5C6APU8_9BACT|nr:hypothetical protein [Neorhodopirellula pilleata]TWU02053.1 hypothetical protein Pla100_17920 [Neorhodopirellula pilleata]